MNNIVDFIVNNYIWFIVGGIVVILTIIGYFAEKSDFLAKKVVNQEDTKDSAPETVDENKEGRGLRDILNSHKVEEKKVEEDIVAPLTDTPTPVDTPVSDVPRELFAPINAASVPVAETPVAAPIDTPPMEEAVAAPEVAPVVEAPALDTPIAEPVVETPVLDTPVVEPVLETPAVEPVVEPAIEAPIVEPVTETVEPVVEAPVVEPVMETPAVEAPVIDTPVVDTPVTEEVVGQDITPDMIPQVGPVEDMNVSIDVTPKELDPASLTTEELYTPEATPVVEEEKDLTNAEFEKMFPDDPIIINESQQTEEKAPVETPVETPEDVWKF